MQLSTPNELITTLRSEVARYRRLIEHAEGYIAELEGGGSLVAPPAKPTVATVATARPHQRAISTTPRRPVAGVNKNVHTVIMPNSHSALCREALEIAGRPLHVDELFNFCRSRGATVKQASYLPSALYRHKHAFIYKGDGMWALKEAVKPASEQLSLNGNGHH